MEANRNYKRMAEAAMLLEEGVWDSKWIPIGLDGYAVCCLMDYKQCLYGYDNAVNPIRQRFWNNSIQISSKTNEIDRKTLNRVFSSQESGESLCFVDLRTKTGSLGKMLREEIENYAGITGKKVDAYYAVLFDPECKADFRSKTEELPDQERPFWLESKEEVRKLLGKDAGGFYYNIADDSLDKSKPMQAMKLEMAAIVDYDISMARKRGILK